MPVSTVPRECDCHCHRAVFCPTCDQPGGPLDDIAPPDRRLIEAFADNVVRRLVAKRPELKPR